MTTGSNDRPALCAGLKVLDLSWGVAGPIAGMVLSDFGAEVIKIEPPGGDPFRSMPGAVQWHRGKKSVVLDLKDAKQREQAQQLAASADVLIESFRPGVADRLGVGYGALSRINPRLVYCSITGFGTKGPWRNLKAYEGVVSARGGYFAGQKVGWRAPGPVYLVAKQVSYGATNYALQGIFGALRRRLTTGHGDRVETNLLQGGVAFQINTTYKWKDASKTPARTAPPDAADPLSTVACYRICRCSDGKWIQLGAFQSDIFHRMMVALGMDEESKDLRYVDAPQFKSDEDSLRIIKRLEEQIAKKPYAHWAAAFEKMDCPYSPHLSTQEALDDVQVRAIGLVVNVDDPVQGKTEQVGAPFVIADSGWRVHGPAPLVGQHNGQGFATSSKTSHVARNGRANGFMLDGVKVLDVTTYVAAPTATGYLVDYGADVIKVEPPGGDPQNNWGDVGTRPNRGKRSIWLDLKHEKGREVLYKMVEKTDIFLQNFRPGVDQRLGIDFDTLIKINPRLVYCHAASYGSTGPYSKRGA
ncbi:MAG: CoA transferase, partial [Chloroflexi bacterium]|nr:CoA transferase [Chloroflexota bacterium]